MEETENILLNSSITSHLEIDKLDDLYKKIKKEFNDNFKNYNHHK